MYWPYLKSVALPVPEIIAVEVLGGCGNESFSLLKPSVMCGNVSAVGFVMDTS